MSISEQVQHAFRTWGHDENQLTDVLETLALKTGPIVYQEVFQQLFRRKINPHRAKRYWQEALARWQARAGKQAGVQALKAALFDYLQSVTGERLDSTTDAVTGLYTSEYLATHLQQLLAARRSKSQGPPLGVLQIAIDQRDELYDFCTQIDSDQCLRILGRVIKRHIRDMDTAAWNDKGHFSVVLPDATKPQTFAIAERIRSAVNREEFPGQWSLAGQNLTVSVGLAAFPQDALHAKRLLLHAEEQLHLAERKGNRSCPETSERRRNERLTLHSMVEIAPTEEQASYSPAMAIDISPKGIGLGSDAPVREGNLVRLRFKRPYWPVDREIASHVRRINLESTGKVPRLGLEFISAEPDLLPPFSSSTLSA